MKIEENLLFLHSFCIVFCISFCIGIKSGRYFRCTFVASFLRLLQDMRIDGCSGDLRLMAKALRHVMQIEMMQQEDGCMRMPQAVAGDGRDAGSDACMSQTLIRCIHRDRIPIDADKDQTMRILETTLERCLFNLVIIRL